MNENNRKNVIALLGSYFIGGLIILLLANYVLLQIKPLAKVDPESLPAAHTWVWWATKEYLATYPKPQIVLLGSSLVMHPVSRLDANFLNKNLDYVYHHRSDYMKQALEEKLHMSGLNCFNFALPGGMVSDDYIVARALFVNDHKPQVIVIGLSLRDFIDNGVHCAGATPAFRYLKRYIDMGDVIDLAMPQFFQRFDYLIGNGIYLWGKKLDLQVVLAQTVKEKVSPLFEQIFPISKLNEVDPGRNLPSNLRAEVEENMFIVQANQPYSYEDNSKEYKKRYRSPNEKMFVTQKQFFDKLLQLADERQIKVIIVNMPLTPENHKLMPVGSYDKYIQYLSDISSQKQIPFIDLDASGKFSQQNYYDTSHMNASGGKKLVDTIVENMTKNQNIAQSLTGSERPRSQVANKSLPY
jgi:RNase H-fold protein (predicted Holliday junction resolvase)